MASKLEIAQIISTAKAAYHNFQPDAKTPEVWLALLGDLPGDTLKAALLACMTQAGRAFAPGIGEIRGAAYDLDARAAGIPDAYAAYEQAVRAPKNGWVYGEPEPVPDDPQGSWTIPKSLFKWSHPLVENVARLLGWPDRFPTDLPAADRAQFVKAYEMELARTMSVAHELPALREYVERKARELKGLPPVGQLPG